MQFAPTCSSKPGQVAAHLQAELTRLGVGLQAFKYVGSAVGLALYFEHHETAEALYLALCIWRRQLSVLHFMAGSVLDVLNDEEILVDVGADVVLMLDEADCLAELEVGTGQPDEEGTALAPLPITTRFVPQLAAGARCRLKLSTSYTTTRVSI